jgi:hypothetical protein
MRAVAVTLAVMGLLVATAWTLAARTVECRIRQGLGPESHFESISLLENRARRIELDVAIDGRMDDPRVSLSEDIASSVAAALASRGGEVVGQLLRGAASGGGARAIDTIRGRLGR